MDVRWAGDAAVFVAAGQAGVFELQVASGELAPRRVGFSELPNGRLWMSSRLAASSAYLAAGAPAHSLVWKQRQPASTSSREQPFAVLVDMDVHDQRLLVLGARRDEQGVWSPDGAIAWLGPLGSDLSGLEPVFSSSDGPGAANMADCHVLENGGVRFLADGSYLIVPGVEEGVFLYGADGRLERTWETEALGLDVGCDLDPEMGRQHVRDGHFRQLEYLNRRRTLDEILPLADGPALVIREVARGITGWRLVQLRRDGGVAGAALPVRSRSGYSHLRGDVRGDRVVLLLLEYGDGDVPPAEPPRLILLRSPP